nr:YceI family protein [Hyunsoonleella jejuensis]
MNKDFLKLLNSETYPNIIITLNEVESYAENDNIIQANVDIEIAGVVNSYTFPMQVNMYDTMQISGILDVNICDFNMKPPKKALGLVVVNEIIQIDFALQIKNQS